MGKKILAGVVGVIVAFVLVWLVQKVGHTVYPPPVDLDWQDTEAVRTFIGTLPTGAFLFVIASYFIGAFCGTLAACKIAGSNRFVFALIVGGLMLAATAMNLVMIPHPMWFSVLAIIAIVVAAWLGLKLGGGSMPQAE